MTTQPKTRRFYLVPVEDSDADMIELYALPAALTRHLNANSFYPIPDRHPSEDMLKRRATLKQMDWANSIIEFPVASLADAR